MSESFDLSFAHAIHCMSPLDELACDASYDCLTYQSHDTYDHYGPGLETGSAYNLNNTTVNSSHSFQDNQRYVYNVNHQYQYSDFSSHTSSYYDHEDSVELPIQSETDNCMMAHFPIQAVHESSPRLPSFQILAEPYIQPRRTQKGRRGRPPTYPKPGYPFSDSDGLDSDSDRLSTDSSSNTRCRKGAKNILLWKFLLEELRKPGGNHIRWVREREGVFKFVDTAETSRLWGMKKKKEDMNFEKLSRGIRHYYKDGLMSRVDGTRLVYQFNWSQVPRLYRK